MLSDEEKKAIDYLQLCYDLSTITNESLSKLGIALNLIEKQSKEIEELKVTLEKEKQYRKGLISTSKKVADKLWEDKIKAKIEEIEKLKTDDENSIINKIVNWFINQLESLLEKE